MTNERTLLREAMEALQSHGDHDWNPDAPNTACTVCEVLEKIRAALSVEPPAGLEDVPFMPVKPEVLQAFAKQMVDWGVVFVKYEPGVATVIPHNELPRARGLLKDAVAMWNGYVHDDPHAKRLHQDMKDFLAEFPENRQAEPTGEVRCPCGTAYLRVEGGYVPVCDCALKNSVSVNRRGES